MYKRQVHVDALKNSITTLDELGKIESEVNPEDVTGWIDESYLKTAMAEQGLNYDQVITEAENYVISGQDALTGEEITEPKMAAQLWIQGEETVTSFASVKNMMQMLPKLKAEGQAADVMFVHDRKNGWKLFAENSYYVNNGDGVSAFLLKEDANQYAASSGGQVTAFNELQENLAQQAAPIPVGAAK